jgi:hypothetical protein
MMRMASDTSPRFKARIAGLFYLLAVLSAVSGESFLHGSAAIVAGLVAVLCFVVVTIILYHIFLPVSRSAALLALCANLVGMAFEALRWEPWHMDLGVVFHGAYCLFIGSLVLRSAFLPRILGALMAIAGVAWLTNLLPSLANTLQTYAVIAGFVGEGALMLWLVIIGVNLQRWTEQASAAQNADHGARSFAG